MMPEEKENINTGGNLEVGYKPRGGVLEKATPLEKTSISPVEETPIPQSDIGIEESDPTKAEQAEEPLTGVKAPPPPNSIPLGKISYSKLQDMIRQQKETPYVYKPKFVYDPSDSKRNEDEQRWLFNAKDSLEPDQLAEAAQIFAGEHPDQQGLSAAKYYFDPKTQMPKALKYGERVPKDAQIASHWGFDASEDSAMLTLFKNTYNSFIDIAKAPANLIQIGSGLVMDDDTWLSEGAENWNNFVDLFKAPAKQFQLNEKAFESWDSFFSKELLEDQSLESYMALTGTVIGSALQFLTGAGFISKGAKAAQAGKILATAQTGSRAAQVASKAINAGKVRQFVELAGISTAISTNEALEAVKDVEGLGIREKMGVALLNSAVMGGLEVMIGGHEIRMLMGLRRAGVNDVVRNTIINEIKKDAGKITGATMERAYKTALNEGITKAGRVFRGKSIIEGIPKEATEEFLQEAWTKLSEKTVDTMKGFEGAEGFGTELASPESLRDYFVGAMSGAIGGALFGAVVPKKSKAQGSVIYDKVASGNDAVILNEIEKLAEAGQLNEEEKEGAVQHVRAYRKYIDAEIDADFPANKRKEVFERIWEIEKLGLEIEKIDSEAGPSYYFKEGRTKEMRARQKVLESEIFDIRESVKNPKRETPEQKAEREAQKSPLPKEQQDAINEMTKGPLKFDVPDTAIAAENLQERGFTSEQLRTLGNQGINLANEQVQKQILEQDIEGAAQGEFSQEEYDAFIKSGDLSLPDARARQIANKIKNEGIEALNEREAFVYGINDTKRQINNILTSHAYKVANPEQVVKAVRRQGIAKKLEKLPKEEAAGLVKRHAQITQLSKVAQNVEDVANPKELVISENIGKVNPQSFARFADPNLLKDDNNMRMAYFVRRKGESPLRDIDQIAADASLAIEEQTGVANSISPEDVVDFIMKYPHGVGGRMSQSERTFMGANNPQRGVKKALREIADELGVKESELDTAMDLVGEIADQQSVESRIGRLNEELDILDKNILDNPAESINEATRILDELYDETALSPEQYDGFKERLRPHREKYVQSGQAAKDIDNEAANGLEGIATDLPFQKQEYRQMAERAVSMQNIFTIAKGIAKKFPGSNVYMDKWLFDNTLSKSGYSGDLTNAPLGFVYQGDVYINPDKATLETPVHEFGHIWVELTKKNNQELYKQGIDLVRATKYEDFARENYSELSEEKVLDEALATSIGDQGAQILEDNLYNETFYDKVRKFFKDLFNDIAEFFGLPKNNGLEQDSITAFANSVATQLLSKDSTALFTPQQMKLKQDLDVMYQKSVPKPERDAVRGYANQRYGLNVSIDFKSFLTKDPYLKGFGKLRKGYGDLLSKISPISTEIGKLSLPIKNKLRDFALNLSLQEESDRKAWNPFLDKIFGKGLFLKKGIDKADIIELELLLVNQKTFGEGEKKIKELGLEKEWTVFKKALKDIGKRSAESGVDTNLIEDYFPRVVSDTKGLLAYLSGKNQYSALLDTLKVKEDEYFRKNGTQMPDDVRAATLDSLLVGFKDASTELAKTGNEKARTITNITADMLQFYYPMHEAIPMYFNRMNNAIEARKLFGRKDKDGNPIELKESLTWELMKEIENGLPPESVDKIRDLLMARFDRGTPNKYFRLAKNIGLMAVLGNFGSALTQMQDIAFSIQKAGVYHTGKFYPQVWKNRLAKVKDPKIWSKEEFGIVDRITAEQGNIDSSSFWVNRILRLSGLNFFDSIGKDTYINAVHSKMQAEIKKDKNAFKSGIMKEFTLSEQEADKAISDIENDVHSYEVKKILFSKLSDVHPLDDIEMPENYNKWGNKKIFYTLKSFTVKQIDFQRREFLDKMVQGVERKDRDLFMEGAKNMITFATAFVAMGMGADALRDLLFGRELNIEDTTYENLFKLSGFSRYTVYNTRKKGLVGGAIDFVMPPTDYLNDLYFDAMSLGDDKGFKSSKYVPILGKPFYYWFGRGAN